MQVEFDGTLRSDDILHVNASLSTLDGVEIDLNRAEPLAGDPGWYKLDGSMFEKPSLDDPVLDRVIDAGEAGAVLGGDDVPDFLERVEAKSKRIAGVRRHGTLASQSVCTSDPTHCFQIDGDDDAVSLEQLLAYRDRYGNVHTQSIDGADGILKAKGADRAYRRTAHGWTAIRREHVVGAGKRARSCESQRKVDVVRGYNIPDLLSGLAEEVRASSPWNVYVSDLVRQRHKLIEDKTQVSFAVGVVDRGTEKLLHLDPLYDQQKQLLTHAEIARAVSEDRKWIRRPRVWIRIDRKKYAAVQRKLMEEHVEHGPDGYVFNAVDRDRVLSALAQVGRIETTDSYSRFLEQLMQFRGIEHIDAPLHYPRTYRFMVTATRI